MPSRTGCIWCAHYLGVILCTVLRGSGSGSKINNVVSEVSHVVYNFSSWAYRFTPVNVKNLTHTRNDICKNSWWFRLETRRKQSSAFKHGNHHHHQQISLPSTPGWFSDITAQCLTLSMSFVLVFCSQPYGELLEVCGLTIFTVTGADSVEAFLYLLHLTLTGQVNSASVALSWEVQHPAGFQPWLWIFSSWLLAKCW